MDAAEARGKLRSVFLTLEGTPPAERDARLRQEVKAILAKVPKADQPAVVERLASAFPVWPPDVPPPAPPTDEEMIQTLRMRMDSSDGDRRRIMSLMRAAGLGSGLNAGDEQAVRDKVAVDPAQQPEVGRIVDAFLVFTQAAADADSTVRKFLQEHGLGMMMVGVPRLRESLAKLLTVADGDPSRHAKRAELETAANQLVRAIALLCHWPDNFAEDASIRLSPSRIEATVPSKAFKRPDPEGYWREYVTRVGGRKDESNVKAELLSWMANMMRDTIG